MAPANCISLGILAIYLAGFFWGTIEAARAAGQSVWLFGKASGSTDVTLSTLRTLNGSTGCRPAWGLFLN